MKHFLYISLFGILGLLVSTMMHALIELVALELIFADPENASSWWWQEWQLIHSSVSALLWIIGLVGGVYLGFIWWSKYGSKPGAFGWKAG